MGWLKGLFYKVGKMGKDEQSMVTLVTLATKLQCWYRRGLVELLWGEEKARSLSLVEGTVRNGWGRVPLQRALCSHELPPVRGAVQNGGMALLVVLPEPSQVLSMRGCSMASIPCSCRGPAPCLESFNFLFLWQSP